MFLTALDTGERVQIPVLPDRLKIKDGVQTADFSILNVGETRTPRGRALARYTFKGIFPGEVLGFRPIVKDYQPPDRIIKTLRSLQARGARLRFMVSGLNLTDEVFIDAFETEYRGGAGDVEYEIDLVEYRTIAMRVVPPQSLPPVVSTETAAEASESANGKTGTVRLNNPSSHLNVRSGAGTKHRIIGKLSHGAKVQLLSKSGSWYQIPYGSGKGWVHGSYIRVITQPAATTQTTAPKESSATASSHTVRSGDTLYGIAKLRLNKGSRYPEIYKLNKTAIDKANKNKKVDKYTIYPGQKLKLPK